VNLKKTKGTTRALRAGNSAASPRAYCSRIIDESSFLTTPRCSRRFTSLGLFLSIKFHRVIRHLSLSLSLHRGHLNSNSREARSCILRVPVLSFAFFDAYVERNTENRQGRMRCLIINSKKKKRKERRCVSVIRDNLENNASKLNWPKLAIG